MSALMKNVLIVSFLILWISVTNKDRSDAFLSRSSSSNSNSGSSSGNSGSSSGNSGSGGSGSNSGSSSSSNSRVREAIREKYHRVVDPKDSRSDSSSSSNSRVREAIKDKYHRIVDHKDPKEPKPDSSNSGGTGHRISDTIHRISDKIHKPKDPTPKVDQPYNPKPNPYVPPPPPPGPQPNPYVPPPPVPGPGSGYNPYGPAKTRKVEKIGSLAKKIFMFSKNKHKSGNRHNYYAGMYNDYNYRPDRYGQISGSVCRNYLEYDGIVFGEFRCPIEGFEYDETMCCGMPNEQYCCTPRDAQMEANYGPGGSSYNDNRYNNNNNNRHQGRSDLAIFFAIFIPLMLVSCILLGICMFFCYKKRIYEKVLS